MDRIGGTIREKCKSKSKLEELFEKKNGLVYETECKVSTREGAIFGLENFRTGGFSSVSKSVSLVVRENVSSELEELEKERNEVIENLEIKGISKIVEEFVNNYKEVTEGLNSVRTSLCEESMSLNHLENFKHKGHC